MSRPYSVLLGQMSGVTVAATVLHVVSVGEISILRDLDLFSSGVAAACSVRSAVGDCIITRFLASANPDSFEWRGRQVFNYGDSIRIVIESGTWWARASGYRLTA